MVYFWWLQLWASWVHTRSSHPCYIWNHNYFWTDVLHGSWAMHYKMFNQKKTWNKSTFFWWHYTTRKMKICHFVAFGDRTYSSSLFCSVQSSTRFKIYSNLVHFCPNFQIFCPFSEGLFSFSVKPHLYP